MLWGEDICAHVLSQVYLPKEGSPLEVTYYVRSPNSFATQQSPQFTNARMGLASEHKAGWCEAWTKAQRLFQVRLTLECGEKTQCQIGDKTVKPQAVGAGANSVP